MPSTLSTDLPSAPAETDAAGRAGSGPATIRSARAHRSRPWPRRVLIGLNILVGLCLLASSALYAYVRFRFGQIHRVTIAGLTIGAAPDGNNSADSPAGPPMNILVVGSDTRAGLANGAQFGGAAVGGARSDTIMIVHLNPAARTASLLSIPRDLWVPIPGMGHQRINTAFNTGPDLLVRSIQDDLGIPINHYVDVDFDTFRQVVNAVGGLKFWYPEPVRDNDNGVNDSGLNITTPGCYTLSGDMALSLVRTRHLQYQDTGRWIYEPQSDLARIRRQQLFIKKMITHAENLGLTDFAKLNGVVGGVVSNLTVDSGFSETQMVNVARRYRGFNPAALPTATLPATPKVVGGADVLLPEPAADQQVINLWEGIQPPTTNAATSSSTGGSSPSTATTPTAVTVTVRNGSGISHQAAQAAQALQTAGYRASAAGSAPNYSYNQSVIRYAPADQGAAQTLQGQIVGGAQLQADTTQPGGTLTLITGATFQGVNTTSTPSPAAPGATTPAAAAPDQTNALAAAPGNTSTAPAFPGPHGQDPPPPGSGC